MKNPGTITKFVMLCLLSVVFIGICKSTSAYAGTTVTFYGNGGNIGSNSSYTTKVDTVAQYQSAVYYTKATRTGYNFDGWYDSKGVKASSTIRTALYAHWTPKTFTVTFNYNGNGQGNSSKTVTYGKTFGSLPTPYRSYFTFDGWYTDPTGGYKVISSSIYGTNGNKTLYARWKPNVNFDAINNKFKNTNFYSTCSANGSRCTYNFGHVALTWYANATGRTLCPDSALCELMNRALASDNKLTSTSFFDIKDIIVGNTITESNQQNNTSELLKNAAITNVKNSNGSTLIGLPASLKNCRFEEKIDYEKYRNELTFTSNCFNVSGYQSQTYKFTLLWHQSSLTKDQLISLLFKHPEGLYIRINHKSSTEGHSLILSRYDGNGTLYYIDNGNTNVKESTFNGITSWIKSEYGNETNFIKNICQIGYVIK